jgi:MFS family permease
MIAKLKDQNNRSLRQARIAISMFFLVNGIVTASLPTRLPTIQAKLALSSGQLGFALLSTTLSGLIAMTIAGRIAKHRSGGLIMTVAAITMATALALLAFAPNLPLLIVSLILFGIGSGAMDIMINIEGAEIEEAWGQPIFNSFHACFSIGGLIGAFLGNLLAAQNILPEIHFSAITLLCCGCILWSSRFFLSPKPAQKAAPNTSKKRLAGYFSLTVIMLGMIAFSALLSVGAMFDWSALYLSTTIHSGAGPAATGFVSFLLCMTLGRGLGDSLARRFGASGLVRAAGILAAGGMALALLFARTPLVLIGFGLVGLGLSVPFPLVLSSAGKISGQAKGPIMMLITTCGYFGILVGPPLIGFIAEQLGLRVALTLIIFLCSSIAICASAVNTTTRNQHKANKESEELLLPR